MGWNLVWNRPPKFTPTSAAVGVWDPKNVNFTKFSNICILWAYPSRESYEIFKVCGQFHGQSSHAKFNIWPWWVKWVGFRQEPHKNKIWSNFRILAPQGQRVWTDRGEISRGRVQGDATGRALDLRLTKPYSWQSCVTTLDKLFTPMCFCNRAV